MNTWAILLAAGQGARMAGHGCGLPKQFMPFEDAPLFWRSALTLARLPALRGIVFVFPPEDAPTGPGDQAPVPHADYGRLLSRLDAGGVLGLPWRLAAGGELRQDSVANGLDALPDGCDAVLVHDSARPFASAALMTRVMKALAQGHEAVVPGIAVNDTIKTVDAGGRVLHTLERSALRAAQTPQGFALKPLRAAHARAREEEWAVTDDASLLERCGTAVVVVPGEEENRKITTPRDLELLQAGRPAVDNGAVACAGLGYDVHRYGGNRPFILGGVPIRCDVSVCAHSDGDTLLHALMDALLGCIGGGDIGTLFPDSDPALENVSSGVLLAEVLERCRVSGFVLTHVDITVIAQVPRIAPHRQAIAANLAKLLSLPPQAVNVKATTEEHLGFTGEKKGIKVMALVSGLRPSASPEKRA